MLECTHFLELSKPLQLYIFKLSKPLEAVLLFVLLFLSFQATAAASMFVVFFYV